MLMAKEKEVKGKKEAVAAQKEPKGGCDCGCDCCG